MSQEKQPTAPPLHQTHIGEQFLAYFQYQRKLLKIEDTSVEEQKYFNQMAGRYDSTWGGSCHAIGVLLLAAEMISERSAQQSEKSAPEVSPETPSSTPIALDKPDDAEMMLSYFQKIAEWDSKSDKLDEETRQAFEKLLSWLEALTYPENYFLETRRPNSYKQLEIFSKKEGILTLKKDFALTKFVKDIKDLAFLKEIVDKDVFLLLTFRGHILKEEKQKKFLGLKNKINNISSASNLAHVIDILHKNQKYYLIDSEAEYLLIDSSHSDDLIKDLFNGSKVVLRMAKTDTMTLCIEGLRLVNSKEDAKVPKNMQKAKENLTQQREKLLDHKKYGVSKKTFLHEIAQVAAYKGDSETCLFAIKDFKPKWFAKNKQIVKLALISAIKDNFIPEAIELIQLIHKKSEKIDRYYEIDVLEEAFLHAIELDRVEIYQALIKMHPDFRKYGAPTAEKAYALNINEENPIHLAAHHLSLRVIKIIPSQLLKELINYKDHEGFTPLMSAIAHNKPSAKCNEMVKFLIEKGTDLTQKSYKGKTAFTYALQGKHWEAAKLILDASKKLSLADFHEGLRQAPSDLYASIIAKHPGWINQKDDKGLPPLHRAVIDADINKINILLQAGANLHEKDSHGKTALAYAEKDSDIETRLNLLLEKPDEKRETLPSAKLISSFSLMKEISAQSIQSSESTALPKKGILATQKTETENVL